MDIKKHCKRVVEPIDLSTEEMRAVDARLMYGACNDAQIGLLVRPAHEQVKAIDEITGAAMVSAELASGVRVRVSGGIPAVGREGRYISTSYRGGAVVAAAGGKWPACNRAVSGKSGALICWKAAGCESGLTPEGRGAVSRRSCSDFMF